jgi:ligand-binding sensor domain-containing protein
LFNIENNKRSLQAEISIQSDSIWIWTREGRVYCFCFGDEEASPLQTQNIAAVPVLISASDHGKKWALYDRRSRSVQVWERSGETLLQKKAQSPALEAEKLPKFATWLDESTLLLVDAVSSIWVFAYAKDASEISLLHSCRLATKSIFALQRDDSRAETFWIGKKDGCALYRLKRDGCEIALEVLGSNCLHHGVVKEVGDTNVCD